MLRLNSDYDIESELYDVVALFFDVQKDEVNINCGFLERTPYITVNGAFYHLMPPYGKFSRYCKAELYRVLSAYTGKTFPWGALTGVRPTKLAYELEEGVGAFEGLIRYGVSEEKARIVERIIRNQRGFKQSTQKVNLYVHIPFCTSRCNYCSFVSLPTAHNERLMSDYVDFLIKEIAAGVQTLAHGDYIVASVYIGGGTPTALSASDLRRVLDAIPYKNVEFTVEAGRPDTMTDEKLSIMKDCGVTRISVNPQSFVDRTLKLIGRNHSADDIISVYNKAKDVFTVNMDLIAGLSGEDESDFEYTLNKTAQLMPHNVTVHTLAKKNGSILKNDEGALGSGTAKMVDTAYKTLTNIGYEPYYLYRQKNMVENLENIGYSLKGYMCENNITTMEEFYSVFACGAGAISKRIFSGGRIERLANVRDVKLYMEQFDERLEKKTKFFL